MKYYLFIFAASSLLIITANSSETNDPCATFTCPKGTKCEAQQVQCIRAPCHPIARCVPTLDKHDDGNVKSKREASGTYPDNDPCSVVRCRGKCIVVQDCSDGVCHPRAKCVPRKETSSAEVENPCAAVLCKEGTKCVAEIVQCFTTPCPPIVNCVPIDSGDGIAEHIKKEVTKDQ